MNFVRRVFFTLSAILSFVSLTSSNVFAATISYVITEGVVAYQVSVKGEVFYEKNLTIGYKSGQILLSSNPDGTGSTYADDAVVMTFRKQGSSEVKTFKHEYETKCSNLRALAPKDLTSYFSGEGAYEINVKIKDECGYWAASSAMYLVNNSAPEPSVSPTPTPPEPFLDLPWNYEGRNFDDLAFSPNSWFDHEYPLQNHNCCIESTLIYSGGDRKLLDYKSHSGYDYGRRHGVKLNTPVLAAASGWATFTPEDKSKGAGNMIKIDHLNGYQTWYEHLQIDGLAINVEGQKVFVNKGQEIGRTGYTGNSFPKDERGAHIHFSVFKDINGNGNFDDDRLFGLMDPLGWEGKDDQGNPVEDPWVKIGGARSYRLFIKHPPDDIKQISQKGGQLISGDGDTTINVPQNATNSAFTLTHKKGPFESYQKDGITIESIVPSFFLDALNSTGEKITQLREAFEIVVKYEPLNIKFVKESTLAGYYFNEILNEWTPLPSIVDEVNNTITFYTTHNSQFAVMGEAIDKIPPTSQIVINGVKGQDTWYRSDVQIDLIGEDNEGGLGLEYTLFTLDGDNWDIYKEAFNFMKEQEYILTYQSFDIAGNEGETQTQIIKIDKTAPVVNASIDRNPDQDGWYNKPLSVSFNGTDNGSGIDQCSDTVTYEGPDTNNAVIDGNCMDKAGNIATSSSEFKYDSTPPVLTATARSNGKPYISGSWTNADVEIMFNCVDEMSGVESVTDPVTASSEGKDQSIKGSCLDNAGNESEIKFDGINIDKKAPQVYISASPDNIWPPNGKMVDIQISGGIIEEDLKSRYFEIIDEYDLIEPVISDFNQIIQLEASRNGNDKDGRKYVIRVNAEDLAGNLSKANAEVYVLHDKGK